MTTAAVACCACPTGGGGHPAPALALMGSMLTLLYAQQLSSVCVSPKLCTMQSLIDSQLLCVRLSPWINSAVRIPQKGDCSSSVDRRALYSSVDYNCVWCGVALTGLLHFVHTHLADLLPTGSGTCMVLFTKLQGAQVGVWAGRQGIGVVAMHHQGLEVR